MVAELDKDDSGDIDLKEFLAGATAKSTLTFFLKLRKLHCTVDALCHGRHSTSPTAAHSTALPLHNPPHSTRLTCSLIAAMQSKTQDPEGEEIIMEAFKTFDADGSGALSHSEMREVLSHLGEKMDDDEITDLIQTVDIDGDGEVDLKEFLAVVLDRAFVL